MIDSDETAITATDLRFCDMEAGLFNAAVGALTAEGWTPPPLDFYGAPEGVRRTVWASVCYGILCASADAFAVTPQAKRSAQVLAGLRWTADALAREGIDRSAARAAAVNFAAAATVAVGGQAQDRHAHVTKGLTKGPEDKAQLADLTWRDPLERFMRSFISGDPHRAKLDGPTIWKAFEDAEPHRKAKAVESGRGWPAPTSAAREVNRIKARLSA